MTLSSAIQFIWNAPLRAVEAKIAEISRERTNLAAGRCRCGEPMTKDGIGDECGDCRARSIF